MSEVELAVVELRAAAEHIENRAEFVRNMGGVLNAYGAAEILRIRASELEAASRD